MSTGGTESVNGEVPATPVKREQSGPEEQVSRTCGSISGGDGPESLPRVSGDMGVTWQEHETCFPGAGRAVGD